MAADTALPVFGDDAIDARWFDVQQDAATGTLTLTHSDLLLDAAAMAFDHADILRRSLAMEV